MCRLLKLLDENNPELAKIIKEKDDGTIQILGKIVLRFPEYTDHSILHSERVMENCGHLIEDTGSLSSEEIYILLHSCILHDIGMAVEDPLLKDYCQRLDIDFPDSEEGKKEIVRKYHHVFSSYYIQDDKKLLNIPSAQYAKAIALVAKGHRKVEFDKEEYSKSLPVQSGKAKVRIAYLSAILRMADEFDITAARIPDLISKHYTPDNKISLTAVRLKEEALIR